MAVVYVAEFASVGGTGNFVVAGAMVPPIAEQTIAISGVSAAVANPFNKNTTFVRIHTDAICSIAFGTAPVATVGNMRLAAGQTEYFSTPAAYKVAAISNT